ncbi:hypothetical protein LCGC14_1031490 [marine sediment metagenome]|uniref:Uncharacterized protein n=1 Tax=marine sediment metagenome TaxID=412755 RepID=A0A0F9R0E7_9ZZZZ
MPEAQVVATALRLLASIFQREADRPLLEYIKAHRQELLTSFGLDPLEGLDGYDLDEAVDALAAEYCRIFVGPVGHLPPVESVVLGEGRFWGPSTETVVNFYVTRGISLPEGSGLLPDHLSVELDCLAILEERGHHQDAKAFAGEHPLRWLTDLIAHVKARATSAFYPAFIEAAQGLLTARYGG